MAQRGPAFARRPSGTTRAAEKARAATQPEGEPIPLDLSHLMAPYKRQRGITLRVENLAHGARLSEGRNNGDQSWSLAPDELDGLEYLPPTEFYEAHTLSVRIISVEGGDGETMSVEEVPIAAHTPDGSESAPSRGSGALAAELQRVRDELVKAKTSLVARETELAAAKRASESAERSRQALKDEFSAAEDSWNRELREQLERAAAEAQANIEKIRAEWEAEQKTTRQSKTLAQQSLDEARKRWQQESQAALSKAQVEWKVAETARLSAAEAGWREQASKTLAELRTRAEDAESALARAHLASANKGDAEFRELREQVSALQAQLASRDAELAEIQREAGTARRRADASAADLKKAEQAWKAAEELRLSAVESRWKEQNAKEVAELNARLEQIQSDLASARSEADSARLHSKDRASDIKRAEQSWKAAETVRIAGIEARWKQDLAKSVAELNARLEQSEAALAEARAQADGRQHQLNALQASLAARETELAKTRATADDLRSRSSSDAEQSRAHWRQETDAAIAEAQLRFKTGEAARLAAAESQWKAQFAGTLAETTAQLERAESSLAHVRAEFDTHRIETESETRRLRDDLAAAESALAARDHELSDLRTAAEQARNTADQALQNVAAEIEKARKAWKKDADAALKKAEQAWRAEDAPRFAAVEAKMRQQIATEMDRAKERAQRAETGLADANLCTEALRHELAAAQTSLATREVELAEARAVLEQERERMRQGPIVLQEHKPRWEEDEEQRQAQFRRRLIRDFAVVACLGVLTFMLFPRVQPVVADAWPQSLSLKSDLEPLLEMAGLSKPSIPVPAAAASPAAEQHATVSVRVANLREKPSTGAAVLTKLARDAEVTPIEQRGSWVLVRTGEGASQKQGWVSRAVLKEIESARIPRQ